MVDVNYIKLKVNVEGFTSCLLASVRSYNKDCSTSQKQQWSCAQFTQASRQLKMVFSGQSISTVTVLKVEKSPLFVM